MNKRLVRFEKRIVLVLIIALSLLLAGVSLTAYVLGNTTWNTVTATATIVREYNAGLSIETSYWDSSTNRTTIGNNWYFDVNSQYGNTVITNLPTYAISGSGDKIIEFKIKNRTTKPLSISFSFDDEDTNPQNVTYLYSGSSLYGKSMTKLNSLIDNNFNNIASADPYFYVLSTTDYNGYSYMYIKCDFTDIVDKEFLKVTIHNMNGEPINNTIKSGNQFVYNGIAYRSTGVGASTFKAGYISTEVSSIDLTDFTYGTINEVLTLDQAGNDNLTSVRLPNNIKITKSELNFYYCTGLTTFSVAGAGGIYNGNGSSIASLSPNADGHGAFEGCYSLTSATIPSSITIIGDRAFYECYSLNLSIPSSVTTIGDYAFYYSAITTANLTNVRTVGSYAFNNCRSLISVTMPKVTSIGDYAFYHANIHTDITIGTLTNAQASAPSIGTSAFADCNKYTVTINNNTMANNLMTRDSYEYLIYTAGSIRVPIGTGSGSTFLQSIYQRTSSTSEYDIYTLKVAEDQYFSCQIDSDLANDSNANAYLTYAGNYGGTYDSVACAGGTGITLTTNYGTNYAEVYLNYTDPYGDAHNELYVTAYWNSQYDGSPEWNISGSTIDISGGSNVYKYVQTATLSAPVATGYTLTYRLNNDEDGYIVTGVTGDATRITIPATYNSLPVKGIGNNAFYMNESLTSVVISNNVIEIGESAFESCESLESITLSNSLTKIGDLAFCDCESLESIAIPDTVTEIGERAFYYCDSLTSIYIPSGVEVIGRGAFSSCASLTNITVDSDNENFSSRNGVLFDITYNEVTLLTCPAGKSGSYTIPNDVEYIEDYAFSGCEELTDIDIPDGVIWIGYFAFEVCTGLSSIEIPDSVEIIYGYAFSWCNSLESITIPDSVRDIYGYVFNYCTSLKTITIQCSNVRYISSDAFKYCYLDTVYIDSADVAALLDSENACGGLISNSNIVLYIDSSISNTGSYVTNSSNFTYYGIINGYKKYVKR